MNNNVPDIYTSRPQTLPYCIWYPDLAKESTYREVAKRYPQLKYHVARACAIAGYASLYYELDVLPEIAVAEEARESSAGAEIWQLLKDEPVRNKVMDDYERRILPAPRPAFFNQDTATLNEVQWRISYDIFRSFHPVSFDVTEDGNIGPEWVPKNSETEYGTDEQSLLYEPLLGDLHWTPNKYLLILMAAYHGNVDRYVRLRRPKMIESEYECCLHGIYHSTPFARWWYSQKDHIDSNFTEACLARFTMINNISWVGPNSENPVLPYMIWWPMQPREEVLAELVKREPRMAQAVGHTCVVHNLRSLYDRIKPAPTYMILQAAGETPCHHFADDLENRAKNGPANWDLAKTEPS